MSRILNRPIFVSTKHKEPINVFEINGVILNICLAFREKKLKITSNLSIEYSVQQGSYIVYLNRRLD